MMVMTMVMIVMMVIVMMMMVIMRMVVIGDDGSGACDVGDSGDGGA